MFELFILIALVALVVLAIRGGSAKALAPLIVQRDGQCHLTLAPQLAVAQTFLEDIAGHFAESDHSSGDTTTLYLEISDPDVIVRNNEVYLLAAAVRGGVLYFQAIELPRTDCDADDRLEAICTFSEAVLQHHAPREPTDETGRVRLRASIDAIAARSRITTKVLLSTN
ncbi:MAG: hypothetical protein IPM27_02795 [Nitrosomonadales bacterium]|nr:hypothetical protein [Nitrosomonadales bacterium]